MKKKLCYLSLIIIIVNSLISSQTITIASQIKNTSIENEVTQAKEETDASEKEESGNQLVRAGATGPVADFPNMNTINSSTGISTQPIAGEYANILRASSATVATVVGATTNTNNNYTDFKTAESAGGDHYIEFSNVGFYKGKIVNLRVNFQSNLNNAGTLRVYKTVNPGSVDFLRMQVQGRDSQIGIRYDFIDNESGNKINDYKGTWIVKRLNDYKTLEIPTTSDLLNRIFTYDTAKMDYTTSDNFNTAGFIGTIAATGVERKETQLMYSFNTTNGSTTQTYYPEGTGNRNVYYDQDPITQMEIPYPSIIGEKNESTKKVSYKLMQDYPSQVNSAFYPTSYTMKVELDKIVDLDKITYKVTDLFGADKTSAFTMLKAADNSGVNFSVSSSNLSSDSFANNSYTITLESQLDESVAVNDYLQEDSYLHIPASVSMTTNINSSPVVSDEALTKYEKPIEDNKAPEVNITAPVKAGETYKYNPETDGGALSIEGKYRDEDSKVTSYLQVDDGISGLLENPKPGTGEWYPVKKDYTAESIQEILADHKEHIFTMMARDEEGLESTESIKVIWEKQTDNKAPSVEFTKPVTDGETYNYDPDKDGGEVSVIGNYQDLDSETVTAFLQVDDGEKVMLGKPATGGVDVWYQAKQDYTAEQIQKILSDNKEHTFTLIAADTEGLETSKSIKMIWEKAPNTPPEIKIGAPVKDGETYEYYPENHAALGGIVEVLANVRDLDSESFTTYIEVDGGASESLGIKAGGNEVYRDVSREYTESEIQEILADNEPHQFTMYATDSEGDTSEKVSITIIWPFKGELTMKSVPDVSFGDHEINTIDKSFYVESKSDDLIIEDTRKEVSSWKVNAQIEQELTNQDTNKVIPSVIRYDSQVISADKLTIFEKNDPTKGTFNLSEKWIEDQKGLNLFLPVGKISSGDYDASIIWSLEDTVANEN